ncbi:MAG TPA: hypothetical protein VFL80_04935 [Thermoanaerobaculia bacterium]|nr:hypothetical protein [Thermoanaerobaculia bacterium]
MADGRARIVVRAISVDGDVGVEAVMTLFIAGVSIVTDAQNAERDLDFLRRMTGVPIELTERPSLPMLWQNGTAAVLFHEAAGHAAEHRCPSLTWPEWLSVEDVAAAGTADLLRGGMPLMLRRASFRDVPLRRMTRVVVSQRDAPFEEPSERIEIQVVTEGSFDPLDESVKLRVAVADAVSNGVRRRIAPFELSTTRSAMASALRGATGMPMRYPGVVCSLEGQEVVVGSEAPIVITSEL